jgi:hypothetical protein
MTVALIAGLLSLMGILLALELFCFRGEGWNDKWW